ncbi:MAG: segregation/condensation protein A [Deltaproteobacteria bacterium]|nr:segregation/condensation protein A [Deltaproteobacteria bacterium]
MSARYFLKLNHFEGPLDLLLYLIKLHEVDIFEVNLVDLSYQYLDYLRLIQFSDLRDASTFLAIAASLCEIKTRRLLPDTEKQASEGEEEEDPEAALRERLIEYKKFKEAGNYFMALFSENQTAYPPVAEWHRLEELYKDHTFPLRGDPPVLLVLYEQLLSTLSERRPVTVKAKREMMTIEQIIDRLVEGLRKVDCLLLHELYDKMTSRYELVAYILAMLELLRSVKELRCYQENMFGPLWIYWQGRGPQQYLGKRICGEDLF